MSLQDEKEEVDDEEPIDPKAECPTRNFMRQLVVQKSGEKTR